MPKSSGNANPTLITTVVGSDGNITTRANYTSNFNRITWKSEITTSDDVIKTITDDTKATEALAKANTTQVTITGTLPKGTTGGFKYKVGSGTSA